MVTTRSASKARSPPPTTPPTNIAAPISISSPPTSTPIRSWTHTPSRTTLWWLYISLPLVIWDSGYVLLRPLTMEGGSLHWPLYLPYRKYGEVDHVYGWKAFEAHSGFTAAQGALNVVETAMYLFYLYTYFTSKVALRGSGGRKVLVGRAGARALLTVWGALVMTLSKTVLYWLQEYFSDYEHIGHNNLQDLVFLWIVPNGLWLLFPTYILYELSSEIVEGLTIASAGASIKTE